MQAGASLSAASPTSLGYNSRNNPRRFLASGVVTQGYTAERPLSYSSHSVSYATPKNDLSHSSHFVSSQRGRRLKPELCPPE